VGELKRRHITMQKRMEKREGQLALGASPLLEGPSKVCFKWKKGKGRVQRWEGYLSKLVSGRGNLSLVPRIGLKMGGFTLDRSGGGGEQKRTMDPATRGQVRDVEVNEKSKVLGRGGEGKRSETTYAVNCKSGMH